MTDDMRPCVRKALIDLQDTWAIDGEQGEHIAELLNDAYNAGANDTHDECSRLQAEVTQLRAERDMPCAHRLEEERLQERVRVLEAIIATPKVDANDDPSLTCLLCGAENCDAYYVTRGDGQSSASGIHRACRRLALEGIDVE